MQHQLTTEQKDIINTIPMYGGSYRIMAYAGTGKTYILRRLCERMRNKTILNLSFNKGIAFEGRKTFPSNVECRTFHSVAMAYIRERVGGKIKIAEHPTEIKYYFKRRMPELVYQKYAYNAVRTFCMSEDDCVGLTHVKSKHNQILGLDTSKEQMCQIILRDAVEMWKHIRKHRATMPLSHDMYLKMFALSNCGLIQYDVVLVDEAQDMNPCMMQVLKRLKQDIILVGDPFQQIYEFNGAVNALGRFDFPEKYLTHSFRWGPDLANLANTILGYTKEFDPVNNRIKGRSSYDTEVKDCGAFSRPSKVDAVVCRTNRDCYALAKEFRTMEIPYKLHDRSRVQSLLNTLVDFRDGKTKSFREFTNWDTFVEVCKDDTIEMIDCSWIVDAIAKDGASKTQHVLDDCNERGAQILTAHKSKGLEWDHVFVTGSYLNPKINASEEEIRLYYVACTRARKKLSVQGLHRINAKLNSMRIAIENGIAK